MFLNLIDNAPKTLDTLNELANALADDANYAAAIQSQLATTTSVAYVDSGLATKHPLSSASSDLAMGRLTTRTWIPPPRITATNLDSNSVYFWQKHMAIGYIGATQVLVLKLCRART